MEHIQILLQSLTPVRPSELTLALALHLTWNLLRSIPSGDIIYVSSYEPKDTLSIFFYHTSTSETELDARL